MNKDTNNMNDKNTISDAVDSAGNTDNIYNPGNAADTGHDDHGDCAGGTEGTDTAVSADAGMSTEKANSAKEINSSDHTDDTGHLDGTGNSDSTGNTNTDHCPCCQNHCQADALECGKGRRYFQQSKDQRDEFRGQWYGNPDRNHDRDHGWDYGRNDDRNHGGNHDRSQSENYGGHPWDGRYRRENDGEGQFGQPHKWGEHFHGEDMSLEDILLHQLRSCTHYFRYGMGEKSGQQRILAMLAQRGIITQRELQNMLGVQSGSLSEILNKVESGGYINRRQNERDRRQMDLELTESGREAARHFWEDHMQKARSMFDGLTGEEKQQLSSLLEKMMEHWPQMEDTGLRGHGCRGRRARGGFDGAGDERREGPFHGRHGGRGFGADMFRAWGYRM